MADGIYEIVLGNCLVGLGSRTIYQVWAKSDAPPETHIWLTSRSPDLEETVLQYLRNIDGKPQFSLKNPDGSFRKAISAGEAYPYSGWYKPVADSDLEAFNQKVHAAIADSQT